MKKQKPRENAPILRYEITIDEDDDQGINFVSLVKDPATEHLGKYFSKDGVEVKQFQFKAIPEKQIVVGYAMVPDKDIIRLDDDGIPYYVFFSADTIKQMAYKFNKENTNKDINVDHGDQLVPGFIQSNWITEDKQYDKMRVYGFTPVMGGWAVEMKIEDKDFWQTAVKEEGRYSFSIEGMMGQKLTDRLFNSVKPDYEKAIDSMSITDLYHLYISIDDIPMHPNCRCEADEYIWVCQPDACDECLEAQSEYNSYTTQGDFEMAMAIFRKHSGK